MGGGKREGPLTEEARRDAAKKRQYGACEECRRLKIKCAHSTGPEESVPSTKPSSTKSKIKALQAGLSDTQWKCDGCQIANRGRHKTCIKCEHPRCQYCETFEKPPQGATGSRRDKSKRFKASPRPIQAPPHLARSLPLDQRLAAGILKATEQGENHLERDNDVNWTCTRCWNNNKIWKMTCTTCGLVYTPSQPITDSSQSITVLDMDQRPAEPLTLWNSQEDNTPETNNTPRKIMSLDAPPKPVKARRNSHLGRVRKIGVCVKCSEQKIKCKHVKWLCHKCERKTTLNLEDCTHCEHKLCDECVLKTMEAVADDKASSA